MCVVFLVALPLSMGIAVASGVPPARGLVTGIVGAIVVGAISGSPLQVSRPAAGLAVVVVELVQDYGIETVNVKAGAKTRLSAVLHGVWILALVVMVPGLLRMIPMSSLAAILVITGYKLVEVENIRKLKQYGRMPLAIFFGTFVGIVAADLLTGVLVGMVLTTIKLIYKISNINIYLERDE